MSKTAPLAAHIGRPPSRPEEVRALRALVAQWPLPGEKSLPVPNAIEADLMGRRLRYVAARLGYRVSIRRERDDRKKLYVKFWLTERVGGQDSDSGSGE